MKKLLVLFIICILSTAVFVGCSSQNEDIALNVMLVDGAPGLTMAFMMTHEDESLANYDITYKMTNDVDVLVAELMNSEPDFAIAPINIAAMMHTNGSGYRLAGITTWGIMHIVSNVEVTSLEELKGETIVAFGRGGTPGITLRAVLEQNGINFIEPESADFTPDPDAVAIIYLSAPSDVRDAIAAGMEVGGQEAGFALLAEPVATAITGFAANMGREGFMARINLQDEWARNNNGEIFPQAALIFHERLLENNQNVVEKFIEAVRKSSQNAANNPQEAGDMLVELGSVAIPNGQIVAAAMEAGRLQLDFVGAQQAKNQVNTYLQTIMDENPNLIGGSMPSEEFFHAE